MDKPNIKLDQMETCLEDLKILISKHPSLSKLKFDDEFLLKFVRGRKYNTEVAYKTLEQYYSVRREKYPQLFQKVKPSKAKSALDSTIIGFLKHSDPKGRRIFFGRSEPWDVNEHSYENLVCATILLTDEVLRSKETQENGIVLVFDYHAFSYQQMWTLSLFEVRKSAAIFMKGTPFKVKQIHCVNVSRVFHWWYSILKQLSPEKLARRTFVHRDTKSFQKSVNMRPDQLPEWLGGSLSYDEGTDLNILYRISQNEHLYTENSIYTLQ